MPSKSQIPKTLDSAVTTAAEIATRYTSGDFSGVWDMLDARTRSGISRTDYVTLSKTCSNPGLPIKTVGVRMESDASAIVRWEIEGLTSSSRTMVYEDGAWFQAPSEVFASGLGKPLPEVMRATGCTPKTSTTTTT